MQYNPTLFCQYLSCRLLPSCSADPMQREGEERLSPGAGEVEAAQRRGMQRRRLLCFGEELQEEKSRK